MRRLENLRQSLLTHGCGTVSLQVVGMPAGQLFRRAIGRNWCAKRTKADVVHFCDVDYLFPPGYLGFLAENLDRTSTLHLPGYMRLNTFHAVGDELLKSMRDVDLPPMDLEDATKYKNWDDNERWSQRKQKLAIGGCQIVGGDLARTIGYLDGTPWVETVSESEGFRSCRCDKVFRRLNKLKAERLPICVYRLRHSTDGRDFSAAGQKLGKDVW